MNVFGLIIWKLVLEKSAASKSESVRLFFSVLFGVFWVNPRFIHDTAVCATLFKALCSSFRHSK